MTDMAGALPGVEEIQHHQVSSYGAVVVQSRELGSMILYCLLQIGTKLGVVRGEMHMGRCTGSSWNCWKVVEDGWESWNLLMVRMGRLDWKDDGTYTMMLVVHDYMPGLRHYKDRKRYFDNRQLSGAAPRDGRRDTPVAEVGK